MQSQQNDRKTEKNEVKTKRVMGDEEERDNSSGKISLNT